MLGVPPGTTVGKRGLTCSARGTETCLWAGLTVGKGPQDRQECQPQRAKPLKGPEVDGSGSASGKLCLPAHLRQSTGGWTSTRGQEEIQPTESGTERRHRVFPSGTEKTRRAAVLPQSYLSVKNISTSPGPVCLTLTWIMAMLCLTPVTCQPMGL